MNELIIQNQQLPDKLCDLSKFVLVATEKVQSIRAEIRAIEKLGLAKEVHDQKVKEAQMLAEAMIDAQVRIGQLTMQMPKGSGGDRKSDQIKSPTLRTFDKQNTSTTPAVEVDKPNATPSAMVDDVAKGIKEVEVNNLGFSKQRISEFETMAKYPKAVEKAKVSARQNNGIVTKKQTLRLIQNGKSHESNVKMDYRVPTDEEKKERYDEETRYIEMSKNIKNALDTINATFENGCPYEEYAKAFIWIHAKTMISRNDLVYVADHVIAKLEHFRNALKEYEYLKVVK